MSFNLSHSAYKVGDMVTLGQQSSSVTRQLVTALTHGGLNVSAPSTISLHDVNIHIPSMLHTQMDTVINTVRKAGDKFALLLLSLSASLACFTLIYGQLWHASH